MTPLFCVYVARLSLTALLAGVCPSFHSAISSVCVHFMIGSACLSVHVVDKLPSLSVLVVFIWVALAVDLLVDVALDPQSLFFGLLYLFQDPLSYPSS